jgi:hypothetical protein
MDFDYSTPDVVLDSGEAEFMRGAQAGMIYGVLAAHPDQPATFIVGRANVENILRICEGLNRPFRATGNECNQGCHLEFTVEKSTQSVQ